MIISDQIAKIIEEMLDRSGGTAEVRRNDLASQIGCVPSQINYVITSRFTPERGYIIESRRGGGGFIRIVRVRMTANEYLMHFFHAIGDEIDAREARRRFLEPGRELEIVVFGICVVPRIPRELLGEYDLALVER